MLRKTRKHWRVYIGWNELIALEPIQLLFYQLEWSSRKCQYSDWISLNNSCQYVGIFFHYYYWFIFIVFLFTDSFQKIFVQFIIIIIINSCHYDVILFIMLQLFSLIWVQKSSRNDMPTMMSSMLCSCCWMLNVECWYIQ